MMSMVKQVEREERENRRKMKCRRRETCKDEGTELDERNRGKRCIER